MLHGEHQCFMENCRDSWRTIEYRRRPQRFMEDVNVSWIYCSTEDISFRGGHFFPPWGTLAFHGRHQFFMDNMSVSRRTPVFHGEY